MTEPEKKAFYTATCQICLLAENMKDCQVCQFKIGLAAEAPVAFFFLPAEQPKADLRISALAPALA